MGRQSLRGGKDPGRNGHRATTGPGVRPRRRASGRCTPASRAIPGGGGGVRRHPSGEPVFPSCISAPRSGRGRACTPHLIESTAVPGGDLNTSRFRRTQPPRESTSEAADARPGGGRGRAVLGTRGKDAVRAPPAPPHAASKPHAWQRFRTLGTQRRTRRASWGGRRARRGQVRGRLSPSILTLRDIASPEAVRGSWPPPAPAPPRAQGRPTPATPIGAGAAGHHTRVRTDLQSLSV